MIWANLIHLSYNWNHPETFVERMPRSVIQSNWYYEAALDPAETEVKGYVDLEKHGYDQIPAGGNYTSPDNFGSTVDFCAAHVAPERLKGFLMTTWAPTTEEYREVHVAAIDQVAQARARLE